MSPSIALLIYKSIKTDEFPSQLKVEIFKGKTMGQYRSYPQY